MRENRVARPVRMLVVLVAAAFVVAGPMANAQVPELPPELDPVLEPLRPTCAAVIAMLFPVLGQPMAALDQALGCTPDSPPAAPPASPPSGSPASPPPASAVRDQAVPIVPSIAPLTAPVLSEVPIRLVDATPAGIDAGFAAQQDAQPVSSGRFHYRVIFLLPLVLVVVGVVLARTLAAPIEA